MTPMTWRIVRFEGGTKDGEHLWADTSQAAVRVRGVVGIARRHYRFAWTEVALTELYLLGENGDGQTVAKFGDSVHEKGA